VSLDAEVDEREPLRAAALNLVERALPCFDVDVRWRRRRHHVAAGQHPDARGVACVERAVAVEIANVVLRMAGRGPALETDDVVADDVHVVAGDCRKLAPEGVEGVAVELSRAPFEAVWVDQVGCADLGYVHLERGMLPYEYACRPGVVEMDVAEQQMAYVGELQAVLRKPRFQRVDRRRWAAVEESRPVVGFEEVRGDRPLVSLMVEVDQLRLRHAGDASDEPAAGEL